MSVQSEDWLVQSLEKERAKFDNIKHLLSPYQKSALQKVLDLLQEDCTKSKIRSKSVQYARLRARDLLADIVNHLDRDSFVLFIFAVPISRLGHVKMNAVSKIQKWWGDIEHPRGLVMV